MQPQQPLPPNYGQPVYGPPQQPVGMSPFQPMATPPKKHFNSLIIPLVIVSLLLLGSLGFGVWAFMERDTYKNKTDQVVAKQVEIARQQTSDEKDKEFLEKEKNPLEGYSGPAAYGSLKVQYPKTWSAYVNESNSGGTPVDGYYFPGFVPGTQSGKQYALRTEVVNQSYDQVMRTFEGNTKTGKIAVTPYAAPKVPNVTGARVVGEIKPGTYTNMVVLPLRDKTIKVYTETKEFVKDLDTIILPNLTFVP